MSDDFPQKCVFRCEKKEFFEALKKEQDFSVLLKMLTFKNKNKFKRKIKKTKIIMNKKEKQKKLL